MDLTSPTQNAIRAEQLTELYAALNRCRQVIVRCTNEADLFKGICTAAVQYGGMKMAWIGLIDTETQLIKPVCWHGGNTEYLDGIQISVNADIPEGQGSTGRAMRENHPVWNQDFLNDPNLLRWRERAERAGWRASAALPIHRRGQVIGSLNLYSGTLHAFDETSQNLLIEMVRDIDHAIDAYAYEVERKKIEDELRIAATAFDSQQAMLITDASTVILRVNKAFTEITGYTLDEAIGKTPKILQSGRHDAQFYRDMWASITQTGGWQGEVWDKRKNGEIYPAWLTISAVNGADGKVSHYVSIHHDTTERKLNEERIHQLAFFDPLTELPNRTLLLDRLKQAMVLSARNDTFGALLFIDLDNFKTLNDTMGHRMGDLLLKQAAQRIRKGVREGDTVARFGGDEFVVALSGLGSGAEGAGSKAEMIAEKILEVLNQPYQLESAVHNSGASIGITLFKGDQLIPDELMKQADLAMYMAKTSGKNAIRFFAASLDQAVRERASLEQDMRHAIRNGQLTLHYQAQIAEGALTGAEVLVRWNHPHRGLVSPSVFVPLAEENGFILQLGDWVLRTACLQLADWAKDPRLARLSLAVNVSARQFRESHFVARVLGILRETGANPQQLKLELTESLLVADVDDIIAKMAQLKSHGVGFSLDDFGTGYSSLSYLKRLPLDQLKIDQSFVKDVLLDDNSAAIARTIIHLAHSFGLNVIAEGVETREQRDFLAAEGCHAFQGYLFGRPQPLEAFLAATRSLP